MDTQTIGIMSFILAASAMALIHSTKERVSWPAWLVPLIVVIPVIGWTGYTLVDEGLGSFFPMLMQTKWGLLIWIDRLLCLTVAYYLLQNRARSAGMKSDLWVLAIVTTGCIGVLLMLARMVYLEDQVLASEGQNQ
ncbi:MAG: hypothetical protein AAGH65_09525 [Pseudomonadota bacterium]